MPRTHSRDPHTPRGRPYRHEGARAGAPTVAARIGWMLRVNRLLGANGEWPRLSDFAAVFAGGHGAVASVQVSDSTISRWETGRAHASYRTIRRYEQLLALAPGRLVAMADTIHRYAAPAATGAPALTREYALVAARPAGQARLEELVEKAVSDEPMTGWDWDRLTGILSAMPSVVIVPRRVWGELAGRLLEETIVADGLAWTQRYEAFNRLLGHASGQHAAMGACLSFVADAANQQFVEPMSMLDASAHPYASHLVLDQLTRPLNDRTRYGALLACVRKVRFGHFTPAQLTDLVAIIVRLLGDPHTYADVGPLGVDVLRRLPPRVRHEADAALRRATAGDQLLHEVLAEGRLAARSTSALVVERIVAATMAAFDRDVVGFVDDFLPLLVDEMLYAPVFDVRLYAALLLHVTPYGPAIAAALAHELARSQVIADEPLACAVLGGVRVLGGPAQRGLVERIIVTPGLAPEIVLAAVSCIGHVGGVSSDRFWVSAIAHHGQAWHRHRDRTSADVLAGLVYGLGMSRNLSFLAKVRDDEQAPTPVRSAAAWWLGRPARSYGPPPEDHPWS